MFKNPFTKFEKRDYFVWILSLLIVFFSITISENTELLTCSATLIGVTSLIFLAKGEPIGQILMLFFSILYSIISFKQKYYGEMITYLGMTAPMALMSLISWLKNPFIEGETQVKVEKPSKKFIIPMVISSIFVTVLFYFILTYFGTESIFFSTLSVLTSYVAAYLTFARCAEYALGYALNDIVLIVLWIFASLKNNSSVSIIVCFFVFLYNDLYGYFSWRRIQKN